MEGMGFEPMTTCV